MFLVKETFKFCDTSITFVHNEGEGTHLWDIYYYVPYTDLSGRGSLGI